MTTGPARTTPAPARPTGWPRRRPPTCSAYTPARSSWTGPRWDFITALAVSWAPVYAYLRRRRPGLRPVPAGLVMGSAMSLVADEAITPALGFSAPNRAYPLSTHLRGFAAHLAFGLAVAALTEAMWCLRGRRPGQPGARP